MFFVTSSSFYAVIQFPGYMRLKAIFILLFTSNMLLFVKFRDREKSFFQRMMESNFFPRKLTFTMEGKYLVFITLAIGFAAVNTGVNLLYLLLAMLLSIIVASGILSELTLKKLNWEIDLPSETIVSYDAIAVIKIHNKKRYFSSFSLEGNLLVDDDNGIIQKNGVLLKLKAGQKGQMLIQLVFPKRGKQQINGISIGTRFPFSFFSKSRHYEFKRSVVVLPKGEESVSNIFNRLLIKQDENFKTHNKKGDGSEFHSVREMNSDDDWRHVHWKKTAVWQQFAIKEFEETTGKKVTIFLTASQSSKFVYEKREEGIEIAASIVRLLVDKNFHVGLVASNTHIEERSGTSALKRIFVALALLDTSHSFRSNGSYDRTYHSSTLISVDLDTLEVSEMNGFPKTHYQISSESPQVL